MRFENNKIKSLLSVSVDYELNNRYSSGFLYNKQVFIDNLHDVIHLISFIINELSV